MRRVTWRVPTGALLATLSMPNAPAQKTFTWHEIREKFEATNPTLRAGQIGLDEARAQEITAYLRPNPDFTLLADGTQISPFEGVWRPFAGTMFSTSFSYLHERQHKRELRRESAQQARAIAVSDQADLERNLLFNLRNAFVQTLQAKAVRSLARENLSYYDHVLSVNRERYKAGDIAQVDLDRLELQRVQFESDLQTAEVTVEQFDVTGPYDFNEPLMPLEEFRNIALATRPDLKAAMQNVELAKVNHQLAFANGSTDPTWSGWWSHNPSFNNPFDYNTLGASVMIPLRIFETKCLEAAVKVRDTVSFSYQHGGASLLDLLDAQREYRSVQLSYLNLVGAYLSAANQLNLAVGREVIP